MQDSTDLSSHFAHKRVLVTGGLGFVGSNLTEWLVKAGAQVTIIDSLVPEYGGNLFNVESFKDQIQINISDVRDPYSINHLLQDQDFLFNLAGQTSHMDSMENPFTDLEINCTSQLSILEACRHHNPTIRIVFASTRQIYGVPDYLPVDERHPLRPVDVNGINKLAGEQYHLLYSRVYGIHTSVLRLTNTIGPRMRIKDARQTFVGIWIRLLLEDKPFEVWGGEQLRDFTFIDDCVRALAMAAVDDNAKGKVFNLSGTHPVSLKTLGDTLIAAHGSGECVVKKFPEERKRIDIGNYYSSDALIRTSLGWSHDTSLEQALSNTLEYYKQHLDHYL